MSGCPPVVAVCSACIAAKCAASSAFDRALPVRSIDVGDLHRGAAFAVQTRGKRRLVHEDLQRSEEVVLRRKRDRVAVEKPHVVQR